MKSEYRKLYIKFLDLEIPNFVQILGVVSLLSFLLKNIYLSIPVVLVASFLFDRYLIARFFEFVKAQICDPHSELNRLKMDDDKFSSHYEKLVPWTSVLFLVLASLIAFGISL